VIAGLFVDLVSAGVYRGTHKAEKKHGKRNGRNIVAL